MSNRITQWIPLLIGTIGIATAILVMAEINRRASPAQWWIQDARYGVNAWWEVDPDTLPNGTYRLYKGVLPGHE